MDVVPFSTGRDYNMRGSLGFVNKTLCWIQFVSSTIRIILYKIMGACPGVNDLYTDVAYQHIKNNFKGLNFNILPVGPVNQ